MCLPLIRIATKLDETPVPGALSMSLDYLPELVALLSPDEELRVFTDCSRILAKPDGGGGAIFSTVGCVAGEDGIVDDTWRIICFHTGGGDEDLRILPLHPYPSASMTLSFVAGREGMCLSIGVTPVATREASDILQAFLFLCRGVQEELSHE